jgi:hypothetical protein
VLARNATARQASGRGLVLLPAAALLVHQLRYWLTYGSAASNELADQGHAYLGTVAPWVVMMTAGGFGLFVARLLRGRAVLQRPRSFAELWGGTAVLLVLIYALQESLEGLLAYGHPGGFAGVFGHGGWWAVPAAVAIAFGVALLLRVGESLVRLVSRARTLPRASTLVRPPAGDVFVRVRPLASAAAGRAPPRLTVAA